MPLVGLWTPGLGVPDPSSTFTRLGDVLSTGWEFRPSAPDDEGGVPAFLEAAPGGGAEKGVVDQVGEGRGHLPAPPGGGAKGGYLPQARLLVRFLARAETQRSLPYSSRHRCRHRRRPPRGRRYFLLLPGSASLLPQLPPRSWSGLPAFILAIGQCPRRSVLRPSQLRTGLASSTAVRN